MRIHVLYHVSFENSGVIASWAKEKGCEVTENHLYSNDPLPPLNAFDMLVIMGGPMSVYDEHLFPWLKQEKEFIKRAIQTGKKILGICLGSQLIALALGGNVYRNQHKEIGWYPVSLENMDSEKIKAIVPGNIITFHWHGDTFDLPEGAVRLARSEATMNQAFQYDGRILAIQFHPEVTPDNIQRMIAGAGDEIQDGPYIQSADKILYMTDHYAINHKLLRCWLDEWCWD